jgi:hypothetical protein
LAVGLLNCLFYVWGHDGWCLVVGIMMSDHGIYFDYTLLTVYLFLVFENI